MSPAGRVTVDSLSLPFNGAIAVSRHCSWLGAVDASERVGRQALALLTAYRQYGPLTDRAAARVLGVERTTINARRSELVKRALVAAVDVVKGEHGINNVRWGLHGRDATTKGDAQGHPCDADAQ